MPKAKRKPVEQPGDFVDAIRAADGYTEARVVMMPDETRRAALNTIKRQCAALRWRWLSQQQQAAIVLLEDAMHSAGLDTVRSALCPPSGGDGARPERLAQRRQRFDNMCQAVRNKLGLALVDEALRNPERETLDQIAERWFGGRRQHNREALEIWTASVADDVLAWVRAGECGPVRVPQPVMAQSAVDAWAEGLM